MRRDVVFASVFSIAAAAVTGTGTWLYFDWLPSGRALPGMTVGRQLQPPDRRLGDWLEARRRALVNREAYIRLPDGEGTVKTTLGELGVELDVAATMQAVLHRSQDGKLSARLYRA